MLLLVVAPNAFACRCVTPDMEDSYASAQTVVTGRVLEVAPLPDFDGSISIVEVTHSWKQKTEPNIAVISVTNCSISFEKNQRYVIFARAETYGLYSADKCSGTTLIGEDSELTDWLDQHEEAASK